MTDRTERGRFAAENSRLRAALAREGRSLFWRRCDPLACRRHWHLHGVPKFGFERSRRCAEQIDQLRTESQGLRRQLADQAAQLTATNAKLDDVKAQLEAINPSQKSTS